MGWFNKPTETAKPTSSTEPSSMEHAQTFLTKYDRAEEKRLRYAMAMWGIDAAFKKIFGGLDEFHAADASKKSQYVQMLGNKAIEAVRSNDEFVAEANHAFMNFLIATNGIPRSKLRGTMELIADRFDGIVAAGKVELDRVGELEREAHEYLAFDAPFAIGSGIVRGAVTERNVVVASQLIINDLQKILTTHEDYHRYIVEQYARLRLEPGVRTLLDGVPLFEVELSTLGADWTPAKAPGPGVAYVESIRPAVRDWCRITVPQLDAGELSTRVIAVAYGHLRNTGKLHFDQIRRGYAKLFLEQCHQNGWHREAAAWEEVIAKISS